ncbi:MAG: helix-turn-helix domain-containing protein [Actinomycetota bacterium]|nr:helix-turn-helix domain-containing protein [Actinomycetota bacterium]
MDQQTAVTDEPDFLEEVIAERSATTPDFAAMVDAAVEVRRLLRDLARRRQELRLSQRVIAARMGTTQSALARMESGEVDPRLSTVQRYVTALGDQLAHQPSASAPPASRRRATA